MNLAEQQRHWLQQIQQLTSKPIQVCSIVKEKRIPLTQAILSNRLPINHRVLLPTEMVFEYDYPAYEQNARATKEMIRWFENSDIPYLMGYTGGKSIHVHVFLNPKVNITPKQQKRLKEINFTFSLLKKYLGKKHFFKTLNAIGEDLYGASRLDESMFSNNCLCRTFGGIHEKTQNRKTWLTHIPEKKPEKYTVRFPQIISLWNCQDLLDKSLKYIKKIQPIKEYNFKRYSPT